MIFTYPRLRAVAISVFGLLLLQSACTSDPINCEDEKQGAVSLEQKSRDFCPLKGAEVLTFRSQAGAEMQFSCDSPEISHYPMHVESLCQGANLQEHFGYFDADSRDFLFRSKTSDAPGQFEVRLLTANALLKSKDETALYDHFSCVFFDGDGGSEITYITSERGTQPALLADVKASQKFDYFANLKLGGKTFTDVYSGRPVPGSSTTSKTAVYFQKGKGVVAFCLVDGTVFTLQ